MFYFNLNDHCVNPGLLVTVMLGLNMAHANSALFSCNRMSSTVLS